MLEYNTERNRLIIKEYGRNVQKMVEYALTIENEEQRNEAARAIIKIMSQVNPENKDNLNHKKRSENKDYWHKLWDHLFIISDFKLDIESPFPKPETENNEFKSISHNYRKDKIINKTYGRNMQNLIKKVSKYSDETKEVLSKLLGNHLKKLHLLYNCDSVEDSLIATQLEELSDGELRLPENFVLEATRDILRQNQNGKNGTVFNSPKSSGSKKSKKKKKKAPQP